MKIANPVLWEIMKSATSSTGLSRIQFSILLCWSHWSRRPRKNITESRVHVEHILYSNQFYIPLYNFHCFLYRNVWFLSTKLARAEKTPTENRFVYLQNICMLGIKKGISLMFMIWKILSANFTFLMPLGYFTLYRSYI